jgi:release factor glutamine methyltransferase
MALYGGPGGNDVYVELFAQAARVLKPGGLLIVELGLGSLDAVLAMAQTAWQDIMTIDDLAGIPRVLAARLL